MIMEEVIAELLQTFELRGKPYWKIFITKEGKHPSRSPNSIEIRKIDEILDSFKIENLNINTLEYQNLKVLISLCYLASTHYYHAIGDAEREEFYFGGEYSEQRRKEIKDLIGIFNNKIKAIESLIKKLEKRRDFFSNQKRENSIDLLREIRANKMEDIIPTESNICKNKYCLTAIDLFKQKYSLMSFKYPITIINETNELKGFSTQFVSNFSQEIIKTIQNINKRIFELQKKGKNFNQSVFIIIGLAIYLNIDCLNRTAAGNIVDVTEGSIRKLFKDLNIYEEGVREYKKLKMLVKKIENLNDYYLENFIR